MNKREVDRVPASSSMIREAKKGEKRGFVKDK